MTTRHLDALRALLAEPEVRVGAVISLATEFAIGLDGLPDDIAEALPSAPTRKHKQGDAPSMTANAIRLRELRRVKANERTPERTTANANERVREQMNERENNGWGDRGAPVEGPRSPTDHERTNEHPNERVHERANEQPVELTPRGPGTRSLADIVKSAVEVGKAADEPPPRPVPPEWDKVYAKIAADDVPWLRAFHAEVARVYSVHEADQLGRMLWEGLRVESGPRYRPEHIAMLHAQDGHRLIPRRVEGVRSALAALLREERLSAELSDSARSSRIAQNFSGVYAALREGRPLQEDL